MLPQVCRSVQGARSERGRGDVRRPLRAQVHDVALQGAGDYPETRDSSGHSSSTDGYGTVMVLSKVVDTGNKQSIAATEVGMMFVA